MTLKHIKQKSIVVVAGEESGDKHAADMVLQIKNINQNIVFSGIGGRHLREVGVDVIFDLAKYGVTGVTEVFKYFAIIRQAFNKIKDHLIKTKPDLLILVDYPGFNLRLARFAKKLNIRVFYYISPQIWAWKRGRIKTIKKYVDHMAVIFPFEKQIYEKAGVPVSFVGHPLVSHIKPCEDFIKTKQILNLPTDKRLVAILPGSRRHEISHHMPVIVETMKLLVAQYSDLHFVIPVAGTIKKELISSYYNNLTLPITLVDGNAVMVASCSDCVVVASGTASLECALLMRPMCIIYKSSWFSYFLACIFIKIQYLGLCNILKNSMIVPELLQYDCNPAELLKVIKTLLNDSNFSHAMCNRLSELRSSLDSIVEESEDLGMVVNCAAKCRL